MLQYINKSALVAEIERRKEINKYRDTNDSLFEDEAMLSFINTLEVKEVDLEKEIDNQIRLLGGVHTLESGTNWYKGPYSELVFFAKHFFELGFKAQKGE